MEQIGRGGMAVVFKAYHPQLDRFVAVKVLQSFLVEGEDFRARFDREAKAVAKLRHPNIVQVFDFDVQDDVPFMVMDYIEGKTLKARLIELARKDERLPFDEILGIFSQVASALEYAHQKGVLHRDVKPANVLIGKDGRVYLTDFGIARIASDTAFTASGAFLGTPSYIAPEQAMGKPVTRACDIYSLGIMLYELTTGQVPFEADTPFAVIQQHISAPLPMPRELRSDMPERLEQTILRALSKEPEDRFPSAKDMLDTVEEAITPTLPTRIGEAIQPVEQKAEPIAAEVQSGEAVASAAAQAPTLLASSSASKRRLPFIALGGALIVLAAIFLPQLLARPTPNPTAQPVMSAPRAAAPQVEEAPTERREPEPEPTVAPIGVEAGPFPARIRFTSTSDWSELTLVSGARWVDLEILSTTDRTGVEFTNQGGVHMNQACGREDECRQIEAILELSFVDVEPDGEIAFSIDRGAWGWTELGVINLLGPEPLEVFTFRHHTDTAGGLTRTASAETIIERRSVYVHLGAVIESEGLRFRPSEADGLHKFIVLDGRRARQTVPMEQELEGDYPVAYLYFEVDDEFYFDHPQPIEITVEYFDNGDQPIEIQYDAAPAGSPDSDPDIYKGVHLVDREGKQIWRIASVVLEDARFANQQHGEYDFRLWTGGIPLAVSYVEVRKLP